MIFSKLYILFLEILNQKQYFTNNLILFQKFINYTKYLTSIILFNLYLHDLLVFIYQRYVILCVDQT